MNIVGSITITVNYIDETRGIEYEDLLYTEIINNLKPYSPVNIIRVPSGGDSHNNTLCKLMFSDYSDLKDFSTTIISKREEIESNIEGMTFKVVMEINDLQSDFSYNNKDFVYNSINKLAIEQQKLTDALYGIYENLRQQRRFNESILGQERTNNIMIGFDPTKDKWN